jgi:hypothetical protein
MRKVSDVIIQARFALNDSVEPYRYTTPELVAHVNGAISEVRRVRPDIFDGRYDEPLPYVSSEGEDFPLPDTLFMLVAYYVAGTAELKDDEHVEIQRASGLLTKFQTGLTTAVA